MRKLITILCILFSAAAYGQAQPYPYVYPHGDSATLDSNRGGQYVAGTVRVPTYAGKSILFMDDSGMLNVIPGFTFLPGTGILFDSTANIYGTADDTSGRVYITTNYRNNFRNGLLFYSHTHGATGDMKVGSTQVIHADSAAKQTIFSAAGVNGLNAVTETMDAGTNTFTFYEKGKTQVLRSKNVNDTIAFLSDVRAGGGGSGDTTGPVIIANTFDTALSTAFVAVSMRAPETGSYDVSGFVNIYAMPGTVVITLRVTFTDRRGTTRTVTLTPMGASTVNLSGPTYYGFNPYRIQALSGTSITVETTQLLVGVSYDFGVTIVSY